MSFVNIITIIGFVIGLLGFALNLLRWFHVEPADLGRFFAKQGKVFSWYVYLSIVTVLSLFLMFVSVYLLIALRVINVAMITLDLTLFWAVLGLWSPALRRLRNKKVDRALDAAIVFLTILILSGFWVVQWPKWQTPALVTSFVALSLVVYLIDRFARARQGRNVRDH